MSAPYIAVDEANEYCAFLINSQGFDIVTLHRVLPDGVQDPQHKAECLSDQDWQRTIDLVHGAPDLLAALERLSLCVAGMDQFSLDEDFEAARDQARAAIAKAEGRDMSALTRAEGICPLDVRVL